MIDTSETLLGRLKIENAHDAWREFYHLYWGAILRYARKLGLNDHQSEDVLQETMVALMHILPEFAYDRRKGRFRNFLLTIVHRKSLGVIRRAKRERDSHVPWDGDRDDHAAISSDRGADDPAVAARWRESVGEAALQALQTDAAYDERTLAVFRAYAVEGRSAAEVAARFHLNENAVYQIKNRLTRALQRHVIRLLRESSDRDQA